MENASKALIIAGAILISILLITIGIVLINSGRDITETGTSTMQSQKIQGFNNQFVNYEGLKKGSELRPIFNAVNSSNATDDAHQVAIIGTIDKASDLVGTQNYNVEIMYHGVNCTNSTAHTSEKGYICTINITKPTK